MGVVNFECHCGAFRGRLKNISPEKGNHVYCYCRDCQGFAAYLGNEERILDSHGGSEIFQTRPANVEVLAGGEHLGCIRLKEGGLLRWFTTCCKTPFANTMPSPKMPFAGISVRILRFQSEKEKEEALGPVILKAFGRSAKGTMPADAHRTFPRRFMIRMLRFFLVGFLGGKHRPSPFFRGKEPAVAPVVLSQA